MEDLVAKEVAQWVLTKLIETELQREDERLQAALKRGRAVIERAPQRLDDTALPQQFSLLPVPLAAVFTELAALRDSTVRAIVRDSFSVTISDAWRCFHGSVRLQPECVEVELSLPGHRRFACQFAVADDAVYVLGETQADDDVLVDLLDDGERVQPYAWCQKLGGVCDGAVWSPALPHMFFKAVCKRLRQS